MMRRKNKNTVAEDVVKYASYLPWWACMILALMSFIIFNYISQMPEQAISVGQAGNHLGREAMKIFAFFAKLVVPSLLVLAGIVSAMKKKQGHEPNEREKMIAYIMLGILTIFLIILFFLFSRIGRSAGKMLDNIHRSSENAAKQSQMRKHNQVATKSTAAPTSTGKSWAQYGSHKKQVMKKN